MDCLNLHNVCFSKLLTLPYRTFGSSSATDDGGASALGASPPAALGKQRVVNIRIKNVSDAT
jgi:hypothetical protein